MNRQVRFTILTLLLFGILFPSLVWGHCDRLDGPVAQAARTAFKTGDFQAVQIWVGPEQEGELEEVFNRVRSLRDQKREVKELAERYLIEAAVRLHREAEGMPYTGVKPAGLPVPADLRKADAAVKEGNLEPLKQLMTQEAGKHLEDRFQAVRKAAEQRNDSVEAGRAWVDAYVKFVVYAHGLYETIQAGPEHGIE